jgi:hypothetical protein
MLFLDYHFSTDHHCCTQAITTTVLAINDKYTLPINMLTILCTFFLYSCHSLSVTYLPTISPFGIDGNTGTLMHSESTPNSTLWHPHAFRLDSGLNSPPRLFSPPLTSMSKKRHFSSDLLQNILPLSTISILEIH